MYDLRQCELWALFCTLCYWDRVYLLSFTYMHFISAKGVMNLCCNFDLFVGLSCQLIELLISYEIDFSEIFRTARHTMHLEYRVICVCRLVRHVNCRYLRDYAPLIFTLLASLGDSLCSWCFLVRPMCNSISKWGIPVIWLGLDKRTIWDFVVSSSPLIMWTSPCKSSCADSRNYLTDWVVCVANCEFRDIYLCWIFGGFGACLFCYSILVVSISAIDCLERLSPKWLNMCRVGRKTLLL